MQPGRALEWLAQAECATRSGTFHGMLPSGRCWWSAGLRALLDHPDDRDTTLDALGDALGGAAIAMLREACASAADGTEFRIDVPARIGDVTVDLEVALWPRRLQDGHVEFTGYVRDATDRRQLERAVHEAACRERERLGANLHDDLGQLLSALSLHVHALAERARAESGTWAQERCDRLRQIIERAQTGCRTLARGYARRERAADLPGRLQRLADDVALPFCATAATRGEFPAWLDDDGADQLLRIAQEAVTNAVRHSCGTRIVIELDCSATSVVLTVRDDGHGCCGESHVGIGVANMRERAARLGARFEFDSKAGAGTTVCVTVPAVRRKPRLRGRGACSRASCCAQFASS